MSDLHKAVFDAIHSLELPVTQEQCQEAGLSVIGANPTHRKQFTDWMAGNGAKLVQMMNEMDQAPQVPQESSP